MRKSKPKAPKQARYTFKDFERDFPTDDACLDWLKDYLYPNGILCETCRKITKHHKVASRKSYSCQYCGHHVHPTANTIYHKSSTSLKTWFHAIYLMSSTRCGISAKQVERETGVTYKTAWRMFKQIRTMLEENRSPLSGRVEVDETYVGSRRKGQRGRGASNKTIVAGIHQRDGDVIAKIVPNVQTQTLVPFIQEKVLPRSVVYTDEYASYSTLKAEGYDHRRVHHTKKVYVMGDAHTNSIEGFWSLVKNGLQGVQHSVSAKYLQSYLNEYAFRYNRRRDENPMFISFLTQVQKLSS
jgi:transposase